MSIEQLVEPRITLREAAKLSRRSINSIERYVKTGALKATRVGGRRYLIRVSDLEAFLNGESGGEKAATATAANAR